MDAFLTDANFMCREKRRAPGLHITPAQKRLRNYRRRNYFFFLVAFLAAGFFAAFFFAAMLLPPSPGDTDPRFHWFVGVRVW
jgi:hypothetical protein